jgi:hypothetical protein
LRDGRAGKCPLELHGAVRSAVRRVEDGDEAVTRVLDDPAVVGGDPRIDHLVAQAHQLSVGFLFGSLDQPRVTHDVGSKYGSGPSL